MLPEITDNMAGDAKVIRNFMGEPAFQLIAHSSDPTKGRGDEFVIEIYISGAGNLDLAKMHVSIPSYIPKTIEILPDGTRKSVLIKQIMHKYAGSDEAEVIPEIVPAVFSVGIANYMFGRSLRSKDPTDLTNEGEVRKFNGQKIWVEKYYPPLSISFTISRDAPPGDHNIYLHLVYRDMLRWYSDKATLKVHIKQWYEEEWIRYLAILAAIASILSGLNALHNIYPLFL